MGKSERFAKRKSSSECRYSFSVYSSDYIMQYQVCTGCSYDFRVHEICRALLNLLSISKIENEIGKYAGSVSGYDTSERVNKEYF